MSTLSTSENLLAADKVFTGKLASSAHDATGLQAVRVALITDADVFAGTERHILELAEGVHRAGGTVAIVCPAKSPLAERAKEAGLTVHPAPKQKPLDLQAIRCLRRLLRSGEIDVVHSHNGRGLLTSVLAVKLAGRGRSVTTQHFLDPARTTRRGLKGLTSRFVHGMVSRRLHGFIAVSKASRDAMLARGDAAGDRISFVPNGLGKDEAVSLLDQSSAGADKTPGASVHAELQLAANCPLIVCAARLEAEKDISSLIKAVREVVKTRPDAVCLVAGEGKQEALLRGLIAECGLERSVRMLGFRSDVPRLMQAADVFVLPSPAEPFGLVLLEAMALGKPIVAVNAAGPAEIVETEKTGLLVPPTDPPALAKALGKLLDDPSMRRAMGQAGQQRWREHYTADRMAAATIDVYRRALACAN